MATYDQYGRKVTNPVFPFALRFEPSGQVSFPRTYHGLWTDDLKSIPVGTTLYHVYAFDKPCAIGGKEKWIADIVTSSKQTTSVWGDRSFFIRHQDFTDDVMLHPEWAPYATSFEDGGLEKPYGCPFAWLFQ